MPDIAGDGVSRRDALKRLSVAGAGMALAGCATRGRDPAATGTESATPGEPLPERPNVLVVYVDDMGWLDAAFQGSRFYETPHMDALAESGVTFTDGYANAPNCAPSRASLMTGQYTPRHGVHTVKDPSTVLPSRRRLDPPPNNLVLPTDNATVAEVLSDAGYATALFGKWHLGDAGSEHGPEARGFDVNVGGTGFGQLRSGYFPPYGIPNVEGEGEEYLTDRLAEEAIDYLGDRAGDDEPFFLYFAPYSVHAPIQAPKEQVKKYDGKPCWREQCNRTYGGMVSALDDSIGRIRAALEDLDIAEETLVVFTSDNGGVGDYGEVGLSKDWMDVTSQGPLRGGKGTMYEGGIRVPTVVSWAGAIEGGRVSSVPVAGSDFFPTFVELAGAEDAVPDDHTVDGESLVPLLERRGRPERDGLFWHFPVYLAGGGSKGVFRTKPVSAVRSGRWKLLRFYEDERLELYDLESDPGERRNRASDRPEQRDELADRLDGWIDSVGAQLPTPK